MLRYRDSTKKKKHTEFALRLQMPPPQQDLDLPHPAVFLLLVPVERYWVGGAPSAAPLVVVWAGVGHGFPEL